MTTSHDAGEYETVEDAIAAAEVLLPGTPAPEGQIDPRWQAIIAVAGFLGEHPDEVWRFVLRWGGHAQEDVRAAVATCLLEHLLEEHFDLIFPRLAHPCQDNRLFYDMCRMCWFVDDETPAAHRQRWLEFLGNA